VLRVLQAGGDLQRAGRPGLIYHGCVSIRILVARHSAFYSPLIAAIGGGFLERHGLAATYGVLAAGQSSSGAIREGRADVIQSAVSSSWLQMEKGAADLPVHFAQINQRDGFFLTARPGGGAFEYRALEGRTLLADHAPQPMAMLRYALDRQGVDWNRVRVADAGTPAGIDAAFRAGRGEYAHQQGPAPQQLEHEGRGTVVASIGEAMPPVAFSSLTASRDFLATGPARDFLRAYREARQWVQTAAAAEVAGAVGTFFPETDPAALRAAIERYQRFGCWAGGLEITRKLYEQALEVFLADGSITRRHRYEDVVAPAPLEQNRSARR